MLSEGFRGRCIDVSSNWLEVISARSRMDHEGESFFDFPASRNATKGTLAYFIGNYVMCQGSTKIIAQIGEQGNKIYWLGCDSM